MSDEEQKKIFSENLLRYLSETDKTQREVADAINVSPQTFNTWCQGIALPRMGKVQMLADYFHINKSDLLDKKTNHSGSVIPTILEYYNLLNELGKAEAIKRVEELTYLPRYTAANVNNVTYISPSDSTLNAAHADAGASSEDKKHDEDIMNDDKKWGN